MRRNLERNTWLPRRQKPQIFGAASRSVAYKCSGHALELDTCSSSSSDASAPARSSSRHWPSSPLSRPAPRRLSFDQGRFWFGVRFLPDTYACPQIHTHTHAAKESNSRTPQSSSVPCSSQSHSLFRYLAFRLSSNLF